VKKPICLLVVLGVLIVSTTFVANAVSFEGDASYVFGVGNSKNRGFVAHGMVGIVEEYFADGSFLSVNSAVSEEKDVRNSLMTVGALYRPVNDPDLAVYVGGGYLRLTTQETGSDAVSGQGIYGKFGFKFLPMPLLSFLADVSYSPKYKGSEEGRSSTLITARATTSYQVMEGLAVQASIKHYRVSGANKASDILVGGGIHFQF
jgi:hypothetical protein